MRRRGLEPLLICFRFWKGGKDFVSPRNNLAPDRLRNVAEQFAPQMVSRRRFRTIWLACTFLALAATTGIAFRSVALGKASLELEWGLFPLLIVPWLFAFHFLRRAPESDGTHLAR